MAKKLNNFSVYLHRLNWYGKEEKKFWTKEKIMELETPIMKRLRKWLKNLPWINSMTKAKV